MITFNLKIFVELHIHKEALLAGANRNRAAKAAIENGATVLFFFDADDIMHEQRIKIITGHFEEKRGITGILNRYIFGPKNKLDLNIKLIPWRPLTNTIHENAFIFLANPSLFSTHILKREIYKNATSSGMNLVACGPITVRAEFWQKYPYDEKMSLGEDQHFNSKIIEDGGNLSYITDDLSIYTTEGREDFECMCVKCESSRPIEVIPSMPSIEIIQKLRDNAFAQLEHIKRSIHILQARNDAQNNIEELRRQMDFINTRMEKIKNTEESSDSRSIHPDSGPTPQ